jgi:hypothetical protein
MNSNPPDNCLHLESLPVDHPLRNRPLAKIGAEYRHRQGKVWKRVAPNYRIAQCTYNDLGPAWTDFDVWRVCPPTAEPAP